MRSINWTVSSTFSTVRFEFKLGALFSLHDAKNNHLIFVGSPSKNPTLLDIPGTEELVFRRLDSGPRKGDLAVVNVHPLAGEPKTFLATHPSADCASASLGASRTANSALAPAIFPLLSASCPCSSACRAGGFAANAPVCTKETKFIASRVMKRR